MRTESKTVSPHKHRHKHVLPHKQESTPELKNLESEWEEMPIISSCILTWNWSLGLEIQLVIHRWKTNLCGILHESATSDFCITCQTVGGGCQPGRLVTGKNQTWPFTPGPAERWPGERGEPLPSVVQTTRHLLKYDQAPAPPFSSYGGSSFQRAHKGWVQLNGLNGSRAPGHGGPDQLNGPHCVPMVTGG